MDSIVCITHVPDTESRIRVGGDGRHIDESGIKFIVSPYDEFALEEAIRVKEAKGGEVTVLTFGPDRAAQGLRECLARGATKAVHVKGEAGEADSLGIARVLAAAIRDIPHELIFFGKQGVGTDNSLVGPMVAELLGLPQLNVLTHFELQDDRVIGHREIEGAEEVLESTLPAVVTAQKGLNEPRYASLKGIMAAKKIPIETRTIEDLGLSPDQIIGARVRVVSLELPPEKAEGRRIEGSDPKQAASEILRFIREQAKAL